MVMVIWPVRLRHRYLARARQDWQLISTTELARSRTPGYKAECRSGLPGLRRAFRQLGCRMNLALLSRILGIVFTPSNFLLLLLVLGMLLQWTRAKRWGKMLALAVTAAFL